jgi:hypothetical protein
MDLFNRCSWPTNARSARSARRSAAAPGVSTLLSGWRDEEKQLKERLRKIRSEQALSPETLEVVSRLDELVQRRLLAADQLRWTG